MFLNNSLKCVLKFNIFLVNNVLQFNEIFLTKELYLCLSTDPILNKLFYQSEPDQHLCVGVPWQTKHAE